MSRKYMWEIKQQSGTTDVLQMYIYGDVKGDSYDWWTDEVIASETSANYFREELGKYPNVKEIEIYINSYGGSVFEGTAIYNQLRRHSAHKTVYIDGFACSVASIIAMAGDTIVMPRNAMMMIHHAWMYVSGNSLELRKAADDLDQINRGNRQAYLMKAGDKLSEEKLVELLDAESYLTAEECIELGLADEYADKDADMAQMQTLLQTQTLKLEQHLAVQKALQKQLKQLVEPQLQEPKEPQEPEQAKDLFFLFSKLGGK